MMGSSVPVDVAEIAAASMDGVGIVEGDEYATATDVLAAVHGYDTPRELVGRAWATLYTPVDGEVTAGDLLARVRENRTWRGQAFAHRRTDDRVPVELSLRAADDGIVCVCRERTEANGGMRPRGTDAP